MATVEEVTGQLEETYNCIKRAEINFKKCPKERLTLGYVKVRMQYIDEYWQSFKSSHALLIKIANKEQRATLRYFVEDYYGKCEEKYLDLKTILQDLLDFNTPSPVLNNMSINSSSTDVGNKVDVRLPRIELPRFSGSYEEWQAFEDIFTSLIHNNKSLSDVQRFHYLKSCLCGEASTTLKHYQVLESNYQSAWETLRKRYSHQRLVVNSILKRLLSTKRIQGQSSVQLKLFIDNMKECLHGLKGMKIETESWDPLLIYLSMQRLDAECHKQWEEYVSRQHDDGNMPTLCELYKFLEDRVHTLELTAASSSPSVKTVKERSYHATTVTEKSCKLCQDVHALCHCKQFVKMSPVERSEYVKTQGLCFNCLLPGHSVFFCKQKTSCKLCHRRHHSLLHQSNWSNEKYVSKKGEQSEDVSAHLNLEDQSDQNDEEQLEENLISNFASKRSTALLATALVPVKDAFGNVTVLRALIDQGSQATFISERATQMFKVKRKSVKGNITGVGGTRTLVNHVIQLEVLSRCESSFNLKVKMYVMPTPLTAFLPSKKIPLQEDSNTWAHLEGLELADPTFGHPGRIDMLLGVEVCAEILKERIVRGPPGTPCAQDTSFGWILFGNVRQEYGNEEIITMHHQINLDNMLKNMWELEASGKRALTAEERFCEKSYYNTHSRSNEGRYIVKLPMKSEQPQATQGGTRTIALKRLHQLERRLEKNSDLKKQYSDVIEDYINMNHMEQVPEGELSNPSVYLPHHAVVKQDKETTKVRVVFDASSKGSNDTSLNDDLMVGPQLQEDLRSLIMRWRMKKICFVADVEKMYRQILVTKKDADYQRLLWRRNTDAEIKDYRILRVTFGTASAPYLAVKTLHQTAEDEGKYHPKAAKIIKEDFYMDDLMSGRDTVDEAIETAKAIAEILGRGGFKLQKWTSNDMRFLQTIEPQQRSSRVRMEINLDGTVQALGLSWNVGKDMFQYTLNLPAVPEKVTKRNILAQTQSLFDPLGWLSPAILPAKILMQALWLQGIAWDDEVDLETKLHWLNLHGSFRALSEVKIDRWLHTTDQNMQGVTVHGFCDASSKAYGAVAYLRVKTEEGEIKTGLIAAKTRVAPVKPVSLPRLELCGAVLLSRLLKQIAEAMRIPTTQVFAWTDSLVVLSWLFGDPGRWTVFVSNRVVEILDNIGNQRWFHVASEDNPADLASRGTSISSLLHHLPWWEGPKWMKTDAIPYKRPERKNTELERKQTIRVNLNIENKEREINFTMFDTLPELLKSVVYSLRFINSKKNPENVNKEFTTWELEDALLRCVKVVQRQEYGTEIDHLKGKGYVQNNSELKSLSPYLDEKDILRVGGRLRHSDLLEERKHPIIIGSRNTLTPLIIADSHKKTLHGGSSLMLTFLRSKFWIMRVKTAVKAHIHKCIVCARHTAKSRAQIMGDLPKVRTTEARPFLHSGVDFAGPLQVLMSRGRGAKCNKAYIAIFICMAVKCIHLELVGDMSSESFIGAFHRFIARRGRCTHLWSDQGRNFVGANKELAAAWHEANLQLPGHLANTLAEEGTQWHFIPPYSPNFGGLWEAGVKSIKFHLKRILNSSLTFEEMSTTLCEIEACLNSRPLIPLDTSQTEVVEALTPGHFLIGEAPVTIPSPDLREINTNRLSRWQFTSV
ncbi:uncharacterized protein [Choristoneura fumiferana]|uniref:uncharacterized protein n=1 Tax=Choristoneura fumiferana TaxID=7141 RepID=UPI003D157B92